MILAPLLLAALSEFANPTRVNIIGYTGDAMEPFVTRDGAVLIFNNSNADPSQTDLHWAERENETAFTYRGKIAGVNSSALDAVASVDRDGNFYFITTRSYFSDLSTIYAGRFSSGAVQNVAPVAGISRGIPGQLNFDVEVSADGSTLYFADGVFTGGAVPSSADLAIAVKGADGRFRRVDSASLSAINTNALEYAAAISEDQRELFFTRLVNGEPRIFRSTRSDVTQPWSAPQRVAAIEGFTEAPTFGPGETSLYYHALRNGRMVIERVTRSGKRRAVQR